MTLPSVVRRMLKLDKGQSVAFCVDRRGIFLYRCSINVESQNFSAQEWQKIEKLAAQKGKAYASAEAAKKHVRML
jgi:bifunctional DNA-binding transcriptional regulator/antitoxin component of YhaV-PrlF toxin-antitoxin module